MKELDVFRYLKKYRALIAGFSVLAGVAFFLIAQLYIQQYTAATVIEYTGRQAAEGRRTLHDAPLFKCAIGHSHPGFPSGQPPRNLL